MKSKLLSCLVACAAISINAQEKPKDPTVNLVSKGIIYFGFNTNVLAGIASPENRVISHSIVAPKIGYFIFNRLSVDVSYQNLFWKMQRSAYTLRAVEIDLNYFLYARKNTLIYAKTGILAGMHPAHNYYTPDRFYTNIMLGAGVSWRFSKNPNLGLNLEACHYFGTGPMNQFRKFPNLTVGFTCSLKRKTPDLNRRKLIGEF